MPIRSRRWTSRTTALLLAILALAVLPGCGLSAETATPPPATFDVAPLGLGPEAEVATYDVAVEGDRRPLKVVSVLWTPPVEDGAPPIVRWQFYSESFEHVHKAYHVRLNSFFDLDRDTLSPRRRTQSFLSWESGGCCSPVERNAEGVLERENGRGPNIRVGPTRVVTAQMPLLVRAIRFPPSGRATLDVVRRDDKTVPAEIVLEGRESWPGPEGPVAAERITVRYDTVDDLLLLEGLMIATGTKEETYWREAEGNHQLLGIDTARYGLPMTVRLRSETWTTLTAPATTASGTAKSPTPQGHPDQGATQDGTEPALDRAFLSLPRWDDGLAELAYYELSDTGAESPQGEGRLALSILVKHRIDRTTGSKIGDEAKMVDAFFPIFLYDLADPGGPVPVRRFFSGQARQRDLAPLDSSVVEVSATDQCGAILLMAPDGRFPDVRNCHVRRPPPLPQVSDPTADDSARAPYLVHLVPLVIRALALPGEVGEADETTSAAGPVGPLGELPIRLPDGRVTTATVRYDGRETLATADGEHTCDRFEVTYERPASDPWGDLLPTSLLGPLPEVETYWRDIGEHHQIVRMEAGGKTLTLIEEIRAPHWSEDFYPRLQRVTGVP